MGVPTTSAAPSKTVLITGASRGIGFQLATLYVNAGWKLIGAVRNPDSAHQLKALNPYKIVKLDTSDEVSVQEAAKQLDGEPIDLLINNAGILLPAPFRQITKDDLMKQFEVNSVGPFLVTIAFQPHLAKAAKQHGTATVAIISSILASFTAIQMDDVCSYSMSKAAVNMMMVNAARDFKKDHIVVLALHPGYVKTEMNNGEGDITSDESASGVFNVIAKTTLAETGRYVNWQGETVTW